MSADRWSFCPKCKQEAETLREDWELGIEDDVFEISYKCRCTDCGFTFEFDQTRIIE